MHGAVELLTLLLALLVAAAARSGGQRFKMLLEDPFLTHRSDLLRPLGSALELTSRISLVLAGVVALQLAWTVLAPKPVLKIAPELAAAPPASPSAAPAPPAPVAEAPPPVAPQAVSGGVVPPATPVATQAPAPRKPRLPPAAVARRPREAAPPSSAMPAINDSEPDDSAAVPH